MKHDITTRRQCRTASLGEVPDSAFIDMSSLISRPWNPINPRITCLHHCDRSGGGRDWVYSAKHNMRRHPERQARQRTESREIDGLKGGAVHINDGQLVVAVGGGSAMARQVLQHRENPTCLQPLRYSFRDGRNLAWLVP